jgi:hypothetical protein
MTEQELIQEAENIRDEYRKKHNTAFRIGSFLLNLINFFRGVNYVSEAPVDGKIYGRENGQWVECDGVVYNVTAKKPLSSGYYTSTQARQTVPEGLRKQGLIITYCTNPEQWIIEQYDGLSINEWSEGTHWNRLHPLEETVETYPLTYDLSGGEITDYDGGTPPGDYPVETVLCMPFTVPTRPGYAFGGWKSNVTGEVIPVGEPAPFVMLPGFVVFTAVWNNLNPVIKNVQVTGYEGKFAGDDAQLYIVWEVENPDRALPVDGYKYTVVIQIPDPITQHSKEIFLPANNSVYFFTGLPTLDAVHYSVRVRTRNPQTEKEAGFNITYGSKYPLTYALDGGSIANYNGGTLPGYCEKGDLIRLPTTIPVRAEFDFVGWRDSIRNTIWEAGASFTEGMPEASLTFTAVWRDKPTEGPTEEPTGEPATTPGPED